MAQPKGRRLLIAWLAEPETGRSQTWLAEILGISQPSVSEWCRHSVPDPVHRKALAVLAGLDKRGRERIPEDSWLTNAELEPVRRAHAFLLPPDSVPATPETFDPKG